MARGSTPLSPAGHFVYDRQPKDRFWALFFLLFLGFSVGGGVYGVLHRNPLYEKATSKHYLDDARHCPLDADARRGLLEEASGEFDLGQFFHLAGRWLLGSAVLALVLGLAFLYVFRKHAVTMVKATAVMQVALPLAVGVAATTAGGLQAGGIFFFFAALLAFTFYLWRDFFELCGRLLGVAAEGLNANMGLIGVVILLKLALLLLLAPLVVLMAVAWTNGDVAPNPAREGSAECVDAEGIKVPCCVWQPENWVPPYLLLSVLSLLWTIMLAFTMRMYIISGSVAQWYFAPPTLGGASPRGSTFRCVRYAFGPSFGSLCLSSGVLTWVQVMRSAVESGRNRASQNIFAVCLSALLECLYSLIEYITKFAVVRLAITGETFFEAGVNATQLLARNFLKSVGVWYFPGMVLRTAAFVGALTWGGLVFLVSRWAWQGVQQGALDAAMLGIVSGLIVLIVLSFFATVLLDCVDAVYMCYAMDRDSGITTHAEVHTVFAQVPGISAGPAVEQPDGSYMYGAPAAHQPTYGRYQQGGHPVQGGAYGQQPYMPPSNIV